MKIKQFRFPKKWVSKGTYGKVYKGTNIGNGQTVAVKEMTDVRKARREYGIMRRYNRHKFLPRVHKLIIVKNKAYIMMDWINGAPLGRRVKHQWVGKRHNVKDACLITIRILQTLSYLHSKKIVYKDLNPTNIFIKKGSRYDIKLLDFGSAKIKRHHPQADRDIYKVAFIFSFLLNGRYPSKFLWKRRVTKNHLKIKHTHLRNIIYRAVHQKPHYRYKKTADLIKLLVPYTK